MDKNTNQETETNKKKEWDEYIDTCNGKKIFLDPKYAQDDELTKEAILVGRFIKIDDRGLDKLEKMILDNIIKMSEEEFE